MSKISSTSFGRVIAEARKKIDISQKELAAAIKREDGVAISPQYLNDIEHDRRSPSSDGLVQQLATLLKLDADTLYLLAGKWPQDAMKNAHTLEDARRGLVAFRRALKGTRK